MFHHQAKPGTFVIRRIWLPKGHVMNQIKNASCAQCRFYYVTWDTSFPKGCRIFRFKSKHSPSQTVYESTGKFCEEFVEKEKPKSRNVGKP